jgi:hypothetical protein
MWLAALLRGLTEHQGTADESYLITSISAYKKSIYAFPAFFKNDIPRNSSVILMLVFALPLAILLRPRRTDDITEDMRYRLTCWLDS